MTEVSTPRPFPSLPLASTVAIGPEVPLLYRYPGFRCQLPAGRPHAQSSPASVTRAHKASGGSWQQPITLPNSSWFVFFSPMKRGIQFQIPPTPRPILGAQAWFEVQLTNQDHPSPPISPITYRDFGKAPKRDTSSEREVFSLVVGACRILEDGAESPFSRFPSLCRGSLLNHAELVSPPTSGAASVPAPALHFCSLQAVIWEIHS